MKIEQKCINTASILAAKTISNANSGHTGIALGSATILYSLFKDHMVFSDEKEGFLNRDRLVLSAGHVSSLFYSLEHMFGFPISVDDLKNFRKLGSITPGHPEVETTVGVDASTGPLGQGVANGVGLAIAECMLAQRFNVLDDPIFTNYTYVFCGDGCLMEGVALEAISLAGTLKLNKLILLYDCNQITIDGDLNQTNTENVEAKFKAQNWDVIVVKNGNKYKDVTNAIAKAKKSKDKPTIIIFKTKIGFGSIYEGQAKIHGKPLNEEEIQKLEDNLGVSFPDFDIPSDVKDFCMKTKEKNKAIEHEWRKKLMLYSKTNPELFRQMFYFTEEKQIDVEKVVGNKIKEKKISGRDANKIVLNLLADKYPNFVGGTADLGSSTKCFVDDAGIFSHDNLRGRNILFGIREHSMGAICNGIKLYAYFRVFCSTFFSFSNYMIPAVRMSALMNQQVLYMYTHDSLMVGEDGPTHQPVEQIGTLRQMPNVNVFRPCDVNELIASYQVALQQNCPSAFVLTKQELNEQKSSVENAMKGGYILEKDNDKIDLVIYATGSEVELAVAVKKEMNKLNFKVSVVSFPCLEEFERQSDSYKSSVLQKDVKTRIAIEASSDTIWYKYIGDNGKLFNVQSFGKSGKGSEVYKKYGFSVQNIKKELQKILK